MKEIFNAKWWTGRHWLMLLCLLHALTCIIYLWLHCRGGINGQEYVQLDQDQGKTLNDLLAIYPDSQPATSSLAYDADTARSADSAKPRNLYRATKALRSRRPAMIHEFLATAFHGQVDTGHLSSFDSMLHELNAKDAGNYVEAKQFPVRSFFWLSGWKMYWEAILWSMIGVITSLIYYVSLANQLSLKNTRDDDIGPFDASEISAQVAKMFYAPVITLVVLLGYTYFTSNNKGMVNVSVNHGLILFAFIAGFYSGRVMKLLDSVKNLILPVSSDGNKPAGTDKPMAKGDITVKLGLSASLAGSPDGPGIIEAGFNNAAVSLEPSGPGGTAIPLAKPAEDQGSVFTGAGVPYGAYTVKVTYAFNNGQTILNLAGSKDLTVDAQNLAFSLDLDKTEKLG